MKEHDIYSIKNLACSLPLVKLAARMKELERGALIEFSTDNPCFESDITLWCRETGNTLCNYRRKNGMTSVVLMKA